MREAASDMCSIAHERAATKQTARKAAAHAGLDDMAPAAALPALRICTSYSTRLAPCLLGHLVRNAAHEGFSISLLAIATAAARGEEYSTGSRHETVGYGRFIPPCAMRMTRLASLVLPEACHPGRANNRVASGTASRERR